MVFSSHCSSTLRKNLRNVSDWPPLLLILLPVYLTSRMDTISGVFCLMSSWLGNKLIKFPIPPYFRHCRIEIPNATLTHGSKYFAARFLQHVPGQFSDSLPEDVASVDDRLRNGPHAEEQSQDKKERLRGRRHRPKAKYLQYCSGWRVWNGRHQHDE